MEKSEFLLRLSIPKAWDPNFEQKVEDEVPAEGEEWKLKLNKWRDMQQSKGIIKSMELVANNKTVDSLSNNVLQVL